MPIVVFHPRPGFLFQLLLPVVQSPLNSSITNKLPFENAARVINFIRAEKWHTVLFITNSFFGENTKKTLWRNWAAYYWDTLQFNGNFLRQKKIILSFQRFYYERRETKTIFILSSFNFFFVSASDCSNCLKIEYYTMVLPRVVTSVL